MPHVTYYFSMLSPWTYLAGSRLEQMAAETGTTISYRPFDIMALFPRTGGKPLGERPPARQAYRLQELERTRKKTGMALNIHPAHWPTNPAPSSYAVIAAQQAGGGDVGALVQALFRACWAEEKDIAEDSVIRAALEGAGFDPSLADSGLLSGAMEYADNLEKAVADGVFGSPFYVVDSGQKFWGQDRLDDLRAHLKGEL
ncbi:2-hydroxychromene-2-carboxylate isomerase [Mesobacterium pallidum]|uniref:2-hydroxychromene-2-carboxylate isomerase n=1 Tax=Mesobacterium pallidum TaxID=2872037 RepID=UPI001EE1F8F3|nr:2-hydroxychromene-2-carboxylate isomerase [Mesobacterium pallidum]